MPVGEVAGELLGGTLRFIGRLFVELVIEILIKGSGYLICKIFSKRVDPDGILVVIVGLVFLGLVGAGGFFLYDFIQLQLSIDSCLGSGGAFDHEAKTSQLPK